MRSQDLYLKDIIEYGRKAVSFTDNIDYQSFQKDEKTILAVIRCIEVIGEASGKLSDAVKNLLPEVPWKYITNIRNVLIHNYSGVNTRKVWDTVKEDIPVLIHKIEKGA